MKAHDLRRGNILRFWDGSNQIVQVEYVFQVKTLNYFLVEWKSLSESPLKEGNSLLGDFVPIPLTEELVEKAGFERVTDPAGDKFRREVNRTTYELTLRTKFGKNNPNCGILGVAHLPGEFPMGDGTTYKQEYEWHGFSWGIKFVHELQNLWYFTTGEELKFVL
jgi:hypothetical protein